MVIPNDSSLAAIQRGPFRSKELPVSQAICARRDPLRAQRLICCRTCPSQMRMQVPLCSGCLAVLSELCAYLSAVIPSITVVLGRRKQRQLHQVLARPISYLAFLFFLPGPSKQADPRNTADAGVAARLRMVVGGTHPTMHTCSSSWSRPGLGGK
ncbi:uncharacterized protein BO88DRAFT_109738 [Aspergillus vadensis CBS 113365]|uniref:Uncharacterized protein n=1 Tax=Aspergillus vadensis (strain CBS 113365 / IMI 142717 / IBT 24658) TaxID=1448311 RepID=A0A319BRX8_ASPVC|nr:hypothetical protein BO88DRAFT_109738 [Aspergillus vadensis CBS 113365]PYH73960.1 hypothetical protein BO88DRAFT_109738 [Aspergillus vadensis CBS 113365]